jgi:hypothetical protein
VLIPSLSGFDPSRTSGSVLAVGRSSGQYETNSSPYTLGFLDWTPKTTRRAGLRTTTTSQKRKGPASASPFSPRLDAGVDFYFLAFLAFFFFTIVSSFCSDIGKSEVCLEPINGPNPFSPKSRDLFHSMVNKIDAPTFEADRKLDTTDARWSVRSASYLASVSALDRRRSLGYVIAAHDREGAPICLEVMKRTAGRSPRLSRGGSAHRWTPSSSAWCSPERLQ